MFSQATSQNKKAHMTDTENGKVAQRKSNIQV